MPRAAWHWGRYSSVVNDPLREPGRAPLSVGLPSAWTVTLCFSPFCWRAPLPEDPVGCERKALETGISLHGGSAGQSGVGSSAGDFERWLKGALEVQYLSL